MLQNKLAQDLKKTLVLPTIAAPMFIVSNPELVIAQCQSGIIGSFPALNARPKEQLSVWLNQIDAALQDQSNKTYAVNHIIHKSNDRLEHDLDVCGEHQVPLILTSLRAPDDVVKKVHSWGGKVFHDVTTFRHAEKALEAGVDGLVLVCAGAGGHGGQLSPFALLGEVRQIFDGPICLAGAISRGQDILAAQAMGADFAYIGTRFIPSTEANAVDEYKQMLVKNSAKEIIYTPYFTGINANYLRPSIIENGLDPDNLPNPKSTTLASDKKAWRDIWSAGHGIGNIKNIQSVQQIVQQLKSEYDTARLALVGQNQ